MPKIQGYTTQNNKFETLADKELIKHDLMMQIYTPKGTMDWNPSHGTTIMDCIFKFKNDATKSIIVDELTKIINDNEFLTLLELSTIEIDKGWEFHLLIKYLDNEPEEWKLPITEETAKEYISNGTFPL